MSIESGVDPFPTIQIYVDQFDADKRAYEQQVQAYIATHGVDPTTIKKKKPKKGESSEDERPKKKAKKTTPVKKAGAAPTPKPASPVKTEAPPPPVVVEGYEEDEDPEIEGGEGTGSAMQSDSDAWGRADEGGEEGEEEDELEP